MNLDSDTVRSMLEEAGAFHEGHFILTSGKHSQFYINCAGVMRSPLITTKLAQAIGSRLLSLTKKIDVIVTPAFGAVPLGIPTALFISENANGPETRAVIAQKGADGKSFIFARGSEEDLGGKNVAVVEDLWSTGGSTKRVVDAIRQEGGHVIAAAAIVNRGNVTADDVGSVEHFFALCEVDGIPYKEDECPLFKAHMPVRTDLGHGKEWVKKHPGYPIASVPD